MAKPKQRTLSRASRPPTPKAAAWAANGDLVVLAARGKDTTCITLRGHEVVDEQAGLPGANRIAVLPSGAVVTLARNGKTRIAHAGTTRSLATGFAVIDVAVCHGVAYAVGRSRKVARLDEASGSWIDMHLETAVHKLLGDADTDDVHSIVEGAHGPIVGVEADSYHETIVVEWDGATWRVRGKLKGGNALARDPATDLVYCAGGELAVIDAKGKARTIGELGDDAWGLVWLGGPGGGLLASTLGSVLRLAPDGTPAVVVPGGKGSEPHNHSLFAAGSRAAYVRGANVFVIDRPSAVLRGPAKPDLASDRERARIVLGEDPDDPVRLAERASALVAKPVSRYKNGKFQLSRKELRVFPEELLGLPALRVLALPHNDLLALPEALGELVTLEVLDLSYNHLTALPASIGNLTALRELNLRLNCVSTLPASFAKLAALEVLDLGMNTSLRTNEVLGARPMTEVPAALRGLSRLRVLNLAMNELAEVPGWFSELSALEHLELHSNRFARFPAVVCKLPRLRRLSIGYQPWTSGVTPLASDERRAPSGLDQVCKITTLEDLALDRLDLTALPDRIGALVNLRELDISFNDIKTLPASFYSLTKLEKLRVAYTPLTAATKAQLAKRLPGCELAS